MNIEADLKTRIRYSKLRYMIVMASRRLPDENPFADYFSILDQLSYEEIGELERALIEILLLPSGEC